MNYSPLRPSLVEPTPVKKIVCCDINAWMETNMKGNNTIVATKKNELQNRRGEHQRRKSTPVALNTLGALKKEQINLMQGTWADITKNNSLPSTASQGKSSASPQFGFSLERNTQKGRTG